MNLRLAVSLVFVGTLAYACRPSSRTTVTSDGNVVAQHGLALASMGGSAARSVKTVEKTVKGSDAALDTKLPQLDLNDPAGIVEFILGHLGLARGAGASRAG